MDTVRNRPLHEQGQAIRSEIRAILVGHSQLDLPLTAKEIQRRLTRKLSARTIQWHLRAIRTAGATAESLRSAQFII